MVSGEIIDFFHVSFWETVISETLYEGTNTSFLGGLSSDVFKSKRCDAPQRRNFLLLPVIACLYRNSKLLAFLWCFVISKALLHI